MIWSHQLHQLYFLTCLSMLIYMNGNRRCIPIPLHWKHVLYFNRNTDSLPPLLKSVPGRRFVLFSSFHQFHWNPLFHSLQLFEECLQLRYISLNHLAVIFLDHIVKSLISLSHVESFEKFFILLSQVSVSILRPEILESTCDVTKTDIYIILTAFFYLNLVWFLSTLVVNVEDVLLIFIPKVIRIIIRVALNHLIALQLEEHPLVWTMCRHMAHLKVTYRIEHVHNVDLTVVPLLSIPD